MPKEMGMETTVKNRLASRLVALGLYIPQSILVRADEIIQ